MKSGLMGKASATVNRNNIASSVGSGLLPVFSTPSMIALIERAAVDALSGSLDADKTSVGTSLNVRHIAATPVGMRVEAIATLTEVDGRRLVFSVSVHDEKEEIGIGTHERFIVDSERFLQKAKMKKM